MHKGAASLGGHASWGCAHTHRDPDDLVKHDIGRDMEVEDEILERGKEPGCHHWWAIVAALDSACLHPGCLPWAVSPEDFLKSRWSNR